MDDLFDYHAQPKKRPPDTACPAHVVVFELRLLIAKRLLRQRCHGIGSDLARKEVLELGFAILDGELSHIKEIVGRYANNPARLLALSASLDKIYQDSAVGFPELPLYRHALFDREVDVAMLSIEWKSGGRLLCIPSEPRLPCQVFAPIEGQWASWVRQAEEEPRLLLAHIGRILTLDGAPCPPPLSAKGDNQPIPGAPALPGTGGSALGRLT